MKYFCILTVLFIPSAIFANCPIEEGSADPAFTWSGAYQGYTQTGNTVKLDCLTDPNQICATVTFEDQTILRAGDDEWILGNGANLPTNEPTTELNQGDIYSLEFNVILP